MKLELRQLRHLLALDRHRNFARAAESVGLTQPALSRSLQTLEGEVGARLFDRDRARVEPTAVGSRLIELARPLVMQLKIAESELQQMVGLAGGLLRVGAGPFAAEISVGAAVGRVIRKFPGIQVDLSVADWPALYGRLIDDELDVVVAETSHALEDERLLVEQLREHRAVFYCRPGHPLDGKTALSMEDMRPYPIAMPTVPKRLVDLIARNESSVRVDLPVGAATTEIRVAMPYLARRIVMESDALGIAVPLLLQDDVAAGRLVTLPLDAPWLMTSYGIVRLARRTPSPAATAFANVLREVEDEIELQERNRGPI